MTTRQAKTCGCHMDPVIDDAHIESDLCSEATEGPEGRGWVIVFCPIHAAALRMLDALRGILNVEGPAESGSRCPAWTGIDVPYHFDRVRAAIAKATGQGG